MGDNEKKSVDDGIDRDIVYHYSREHRLSRASRTVQDLYDGKSNTTSLSKRLFGTKGNALMLVSILVVFAMLSALSRLNASGSSVKFGANTLNLSVVREGGALGLSIQKTVPKSGEFYIGAVDVTVSPVVTQSGVGEMPPILGHRVFFNPTDTETFIISLPFDGSSFYVFLTTDDEQKVVRVK
jgi:hypothetical protein